MNALLHELRKVFRVARVHVGVEQLLAEDLATDGVQKQTRGGSRVARILLDQRAGGEDGGLVDFVDRNAVVQISLRLGQDRIRLDVGPETGASRLDHRLQARRVERNAIAAIGDHEHRLGRASHGTLLGALLRPTLAIEHIGPRDFMVAAAHQAELDLILHVLDVERAAART